MAIIDIKDADIREYILGQSRAATTELLDELSFFDEYSDRVGAIEREIIDQYLAGRLSSDDKLAFESHYLSTPIRREKVDFARSLGTYLENQAPAASDQGDEGSIFDVFRTWRLAFQFGAASLVVLLGVAGWLVFRTSFPTEIAQSNSANVSLNGTANRRMDGISTPFPAPSVGPPLPTPTSEIRPSAIRPVIKPTPRIPKTVERQPSVAFFLLTPALRSPSFQRLKMPAGAKTAELRLRLETEEKGPFSVEVLDLQGRSRVWSARQLTPRKGGTGPMVSFRIPARVIDAGEYQISVSRFETAEGSEKIGDYFFRVAP